MKQKKPVGAIVIAILHLVFSIPNLLALLCFGVLIGIAAVVLPGIPPNDPVRQLIDAYTDAIHRHVPSAAPYFAISITMGLIMSVIQIISAIGLLRVRRYGRNLSIFYGVVSIFLVIASTVYTFTVFNQGFSEARREAQQKLMKKNLPPGAKPVNPMNPFGEFEGLFNSIITAGSGAIGLVFPIAVLIVMYLPSVKNAFQEQPQEPTSPREDDDRGELQRERYYEGDYD